MTTTETRVFHARQTGLTLPALSAAGDAVAGRVLRKGETFEVTPEEYAATLDRNGESFLDLDEAAQVKRFGGVKFAPGEAPAELAENIGDDDEGYRYRLALAARAEAEQISHPHDRRVALAQVREKYGDVLNPRAQGPIRVPDQLGY